MPNMQIENGEDAFCPHSRPRRLPKGKMQPLINLRTLLMFLFPIIFRNHEKHLGSFFGFWCLIRDDTTLYLLVSQEIWNQAFKICSYQAGSIEYYLLSMKELFLTSITKPPEVSLDKSVSFCLFPCSKGPTQIIFK